ncbi:sulfate-binding protein [Pseudomonas aeruginosa]|nr:sulfate-binding protein [Pseudomonas aeruginosa]
MSLRRFALAALASALVSGPVAAATQLLNVSYDPTRELYQAYNAAFIKHWKAQGGEDLTVQQSHGGSGKQARAVIDGLKADVVTLALAGDIDELHKLGKLLPADWQARLPDNSTPYTSTIVFLVRKGNPKGIKDWGRPDQGRRGSHHAEPEDLRRRALELPRRWPGRRSSTAATRRPRTTCRRCTSTYRVLDTAAPAARPSPSSTTRSATCCWPGRTRRSWRRRNRAGKTSRSSVPSISILAEPPVAVVDKVVEKKGTRKVAEAYLQYLYSEEGQRIAAQNFYRPRNQKVAAEFATQFPKLNLVTVDSDFGGWKTAQPKFFNDGGHLRPDLPGAMIATADPSPEPRPLSQTLSRTGEGASRPGPVPGPLPEGTGTGRATKRSNAE